MERLDLLARLAAVALLPALAAPAPALAAPAPDTAAGIAPAEGGTPVPWPQPGSLFAAPAWTATPPPTAGPLPTGPSADLAPTGLMLAGGSGVTGLAVDGAGAVWVDGPWQVARFDPATEAAEVWDASDDLSFGRTTHVVGSSSAGVWLVEGDRVRLFDGQRFVVDLAVPTEYRGDADISAMAQVRSEVWIGGRAGVARWADGQWSTVGLGQVANVTRMAVDAQGSVWIAAERRAGPARRPGLAWFDGRQWVAPPEAGAPRGTIREILADPTGLVVVRAGSQVSPLRRFDGVAWTDLTDGLSGTRVGALPDQAIAVTAHGDLWIAGRGGVAVRTPFGRWQSVVDPGWVPGGPRTPVATAVAIAGTEVVVADRAGLLTVAGDRLVRVWLDPASARLGDALDELPASATLVARSAEDAWVQPFGWYTTRTARFAAGTWSEVEPPSDRWWNGVLGGVPVLASDGAVWAISSVGLARFGSTQWQVVAPEFLPGRDWADATRRLVAGADGAVWVVPQADGPGPPRVTVVEVRRDGRRTSVRIPADLGPSRLAGLAAGADRGVWVLLRGSGDVRQGPTGQALRVLRWDGQWTEAPPPPLSGVGVLGSAVTGDGALWLSGVGPDQQPRVARLAGTEWTAFDVRLAEIWASGAAVCGAPNPWTTGGFHEARPGPVEVICVGPSGPTGTRRLDLQVIALARAPDGATWVLGEQLARLPGGRQ